MEYQFDYATFCKTFNVKDDKAIDSLRLTHTQDINFKLFPYKASGKTQAPIITELEEVVSDFFRKSLKLESEPVQYESLCDNIITEMDIEDEDIEIFKEMIHSLFFEGDNFVAKNLGLYPYQTKVNNKSVDRLAGFLIDVLGLNGNDCNIIEQAMKNYPYNVVEKLVVDAIQLMEIYLDNNSSTPIDERVLAIMENVYLHSYGNADSRTHNHGERARTIVENARKQVASLLGINSSEVFFTSGSTESNNIAIQGLEEYAIETNKKHIITSAIEHKSVLETIKMMKKKGFDVDIVNPGLSGQVNAQEILDKVREDTLLVSIMHVNNETGIIQPVDILGGELEKRNVLFHVDATQSCGKLVEEIRNLKYNMLSFSAHKLKGPQGVGVLVLRKKRYRLPPVKNIMYGGQQEHGIRPGTIPVALVAGCGEACEIAEDEYKENSRKLKSLKGTLEQLLNDSGADYHYNGEQNCCIDSTVNICFKGVMSEALMLSSKQYCSVSNGSACTSKSYSPSYVLEAMGIPVEDIESSVRISWEPETNKTEFIDNVSKMIEIAKSLAV